MEGNIENTLKYKLYYYIYDSSGDGEFKIMWTVINMKQVETVNQTLNFYKY